MILALLWTQMFVTATFAYRLCSPYSMFCLSALSVPFPFPPFPLYMLFIEAHGMPGKQCEAKNISRLPVEPPTEFEHLQQWAESGLRL